MVTVIGLGVGLLLVIGLIFLVMRSGNESGRHNQSGSAAVKGQQQEKARVNAAPRASGGDD